ncbi:RND transporter [Desulforhopalus sp. IMCC35007]|uniref:RND transporter n=1 Tax=Desulforhopalus sp. IMCC35007 TaxID=2569543 RepID=UPI0010AE1BE5|nr:RND transporter [Desulforhopalus sp. IMCC35007]TKB09322.1 RND transporter [Desulforhopalus sp. IMCC35007]
MRQYICKIPWSVVLIACATLGLAPYSPEPHLFEKTTLLLRAELRSPLDIFDFLMHLSPFILLLLKIIFKRKNNVL